MTKQGKSARMARIKRLRYYRVGGRTAPQSFIDGLRKTIIKNAIEVATVKNDEDRALIEEDTRETRALLEKLLKRKRAIERARAHQRFPKTERP